MHQAALWFRIRYGKALNNHCHPHRPFPDPNTGIVPSCLRLTSTTAGGLLDPLSSWRCCCKHGFKTFYQAEWREVQAGTSGGIDVVKPYYDGSITTIGKGEKKWKIKNCLTS